MVSFSLILLVFYLSSSHGHTEFIYTAKEEVELICNTNKWQISPESESRFDVNCTVECVDRMQLATTDYSKSCTKNDSDRVGEKCPLIAKSGYFECVSGLDSGVLFPFKPSPNTLTSYIVAPANEEMTTKSEERSSVEITEGGDLLLNCSFNFTEGYNDEYFTVYWIKTVEKSSSCVYSYDLDIFGATYNYHCDVQGDLLHSLSNQLDNRTNHVIRIRNVSESDGGQYLCVLHVYKLYTTKGNWKIVKNITVSVFIGPETSRNSHVDVESLIRLCVTLPIILTVPIAVIRVYFCRKTKTSPGCNREETPDMGRSN